MERLRIRCQQHLCGGMARQSAFMLIAPRARRAEIGVFVAHGRPPWLCRRGTLHPPAAMPQPDPSPQLVASTPRGSTIEAVGGDLYRVCDGSHHCRTVPGLWQAQELAHQAELRHRHPEQLP